MSEGKSEGSEAIFRFSILILVTLVAYRVKLFLHEFYTEHLQLFHFALVEIGMFAAITLGIAVYNRSIKKTSKLLLDKRSGDRIYLGRDKDTREAVYLDEQTRSMHIDVIAPTGEGKTSCTINPWAQDDIEHERGFLLVDGKGDGELLGQIYAKVRECERENDFFLFSLGNPEISSTFNPFFGEDARQVTERVFSAFTFTDEYYKNIQYSSFQTVVGLLMYKKVPVLPGIVRELLRDKDLLTLWKEQINDPNLKRDLHLLLETPKDDFVQNHSGIVAQLGSFSQGESSVLFNSEESDISLQECVENRKIVYFQLPTMRFPFLGAATGKLLLQCLESAVSAIQSKADGQPKKLFSVYLDDFNDFLYKEFVLLLNKSRSANVGVVFSHQSRGDLKKYGEDFLNVFDDNTRTKVIFQAPDPDTAGFYANYFGTKETEASTERHTRSLFGSSPTGEKSVRGVQEYRRHPDLFKTGLKRGEAIIGVPHIDGPKNYRIQLVPAPRLKPALKFPKKKYRPINFYRAAQPEVAPTATITPPTPATKPEPQSESIPHSEVLIALEKSDKGKSEPEKEKEDGN